MSRIAIATLQNGWDCRWNWSGDGGGATNAATGDILCDRTGVVRRVPLTECEACPHWELAAAPVFATIAPESLLRPVGAAATPPLAGRALYLATWLAIAGAAALLIAAGLAILTTPLAIPVTVGLFLTAAAIVGFACSGRLPHP